MRVNYLNPAKYSQRRWHKIGVYIVVLSIIVAVTAWACSSPKVTSAEDEFEAAYFHFGWTQQVGDSQIPLADMQDYIPVDAGESLIFTCTLPEIAEGRVFLFYTVNKEVRCYVDGELIQNFTMQEGYEFLDTPGSAWNQVDLDPSMSGKTCTLVFTSSLGDYSSLCNIYFIDNVFVNTVRLDCMLKPAVSACMVFFLMIMIAQTGFITQKPHRKRYLLSIAQFFFVVLAWQLAELNAYDLIFSRPILSYLLGEIFVRLIPLKLLYLAKNSTNQHWNPKYFRAMEIAAWGNFFLPLVLLFTLGISILELQVVHNIISALIGIILMLVGVVRLSHPPKLTYEEYPGLAIPILINSVGADNAISFLNIAYRPFLGLWTGVGAIVFAIITLSILTHVNAKTAQEKDEIAQNYRALESVTLNKQLEAHFIFNALNTISAYCKTDPAEADRAIVTFASYLRSYLHLIKQEANIPFEQELHLVEDYLIIQQMRFGDELRFNFDTEYRDFDVPAFSIYTIVENAIVHGIRGQHQSGVIIISTEKTDGFIQVTVADTGVGFDTTQPIKSSSVGMSNTKERFTLMKNATLSIESSIGVGTTVTVMIPT